MKPMHMSLNEVAYQMIKEKIIQGEFDPGSRIREDHLADEIEMSRTPVREAINRLVSEGLIINKARKGLYLIDLTAKEVESYLDIRIALEKLSVEKCIESISEKGLNEISEALEEFEYKLKKQKYDVCNQLDGEFHLLIAKLSGNMKLFTMLTELAAFFLMTRSMEKKVHPEEKNLNTLREHKLIFEAIQKKDAKAAVKAISENIGTMRNNLHLS
ncbi:MAG: GntR family transcriptional regulator [Spirochaetales bacterium]|nr:GntR family transcriptional regulator [Spirochaetales bacterium]